MEVSSELHDPAVLSPGETVPRTHCIGSWVTLSAGVVVMEKLQISCPYRE
jgi:hypothetical protein